MDEDAIDRHIAAVRRLSKPNGPLSIYAPTVSKANPDWWSAGIPTLDRDDLHKRILDATATRFSGAQRDKHALVMAGPPGAGKSFRARKILGGDADNYAWVDPDEFKAALLDEAVTDGSIDSWFKKGAIAQYEHDTGDHLFPMELAALVHGESSRLALQAREYFLASGTNVVIDTVLGKPESAQAVGEALTAAGYTVHLADVEVNAEDSARSIAARHKERYLDALAGENSLGGRWVPSEYARGVFTDDGTARSVANAEHLASAYDNVTRFERYRSQWTNGKLESRPKEVDKKRETVGSRLVDVPWSGATKPRGPRTLDELPPWPPRPGMQPKPGHSPEL